MIAICLGTAAAVYSQRSTIGEGLRNVRDLDWVWVAAASLVEVLSMLVLALLYRALLQASQARLTVTWILASSYTANAISTAVPVIGPGIASRQAYRQFREGGAGQPHPHPGRDRLRRDAGHRGHRRLPIRLA